MKAKTSEYFINDTSLVNACLKNNVLAQEQLYNQYSKCLFGICLRMMRNKHDAEDVFQNSFILVFSKLNTYEARSPLKYWMKKIFINSCINELKKRKEIFDLEEYKFPIEEKKVEDNIEYNIENIKKSMSKLADGYRMILNLYLFEGYNHREIAKILDISESTSKTQFSRAKIRLKENLSKDKYYGQA